MKLGDTLKAAWAEPELRQKILFIFAMFGVFAIGLHVQVPIPGMSPNDVYSKMQEGGVLDFLNLFSGGALKRLSIFALGLNPYITSSIILQILTIAVPAWKKEQQEGGQYERQRRAQRTRSLTLFLAVFQGLGILSMIGQGGLPLQAKVFVLLMWMAGSMLVLWLGEQIQEKGIGQGVSLMIFAGIAISFPGLAAKVFESVQNGTKQPYQAGLLILIFIGMTMLVTFFTQAQRRITIQHMRRNVGQKLMGGGSSYLPIPVNAVGVIPIIFAVSLIYMPQTFSTMGGLGQGWQDFWHSVGLFISPSPSSIWYHWVIGTIAYAALIFAFTYFYTAIQFNVEDIAANLKRSGAYVPGVRQGKQTEQYLENVITRITFVGALFLAFVALVPYWVPSVTGFQGIFNIVGGTSLLIIVQVVLDLMRQIEANLIMRGYNR